jgi:Mg2+-importing ATPase
MVVFGPVSSIFDYLTFGLLLLLLGNNENSFHTGWFVESLFTQILVVLVIRTRFTPFWRSHPSKQLVAAIMAALAAAVIIPLSPLGSIIGFGALPWQFWPIVVAIVAGYLTLVELTKYWFDRREARLHPTVAVGRSGSAHPSGNGHRSGSAHRSGNVAAR